MGLTSILGPSHWAHSNWLRSGISERDYLEEKGVSEGCEEFEKLVPRGLSYDVGVEIVGMRQDFIGVLNLK